jgi:hypothetical protein
MIPLNRAESSRTLNHFVTSLEHLRCHITKVSDIQLYLFRVGINFNIVDGIPPGSRDACSSALASSEITGHENRQIVGVVTLDP